MSPKLSDHFSLSEFTRSSVAERNHIDNTIPSCYIPSLQNLCIQVLEPLRLYANEPVIISSGYRSSELNRLVGGVPNSQHLVGEAADIYTDEPIRLRQWYVWIMDNCGYDQLIWEGRNGKFWIHVSCCPDPTRNRQHAFRIIR